MKAEFHHIDYDIGFDSKGYNLYCYGSMWNTKEEFEINAKVTRFKLCELFKSIVFESDVYNFNSGKYQTFYLTDPADEAAFLLWSNNGAEL